MRSERCGVFKKVPVTLLKCSRMRHAILWVLLVACCWMRGGQPVSLCIKFKPSTASTQGAKHVEVPQPYYNNKHKRQCTCVPCSAALQSLSSHPAQAQNERHNAEVPGGKSFQQLQNSIALPGACKRPHPPFLPCSAVQTAFKAGGVARPAIRRGALRYGLLEG